MAAESGREAAAVAPQELAERVYEDPAAFDFLQVVRILRDLAPKGLAEVLGDDPSLEFVRFSSPPSLDFPAADVVGLRPASESRPVPTVEVSFLGLACGASLGSLPSPYITLILEQEDDREHGLHDFLDLFNHRLVALHWAARAKHEPLLQLESGGGFFEDCLSAIAGLGTDGLRGRVRFDDRSLLARAGLIAMSPLPASALEGLLQSYFDVPFTLEQFVPETHRMLEEDRSRLGRSNTVLGEELYLGEYIVLCQSRFRLEIGPLDWEQHQSFFADGESFQSLLDLLAVVVPSDQDFEIRLVLDREEVPPLQLAHDPQPSARLGWSTWLFSDHHPTDRNDASLTRNSAASTALRIPPAELFMESPR